MSSAEKFPAINPSRPVPLSSPRIIVALPSWERALFLDQALTRSELATRIEYATDADLAAAGWEQRLETWRPEILITGWNTPPLPPGWVARADCPLRYVCHIAGTVRQLVPRAFIERGGIVTNWGELVSGQVAEHGLLLALASLRNLAGWNPFIAQPVEQRQIMDLRTRTLFGLRVGLHGFGSVARALIPLLKPFGVSLAAYSAGVPDDIFPPYGVQAMPTLNALFARSDVLFECESLTPATQGVVSAAALAALPDGAIFVNIGRGGLVDEEALLREGRSGRIKLALDVVSVEPVTSASPFLAVPGNILSPHIGGPTFDRYPDCGAHALSNASRFIQGLEPVGVISLAAYDRAT